MRERERERERELFIYPYIHPSTQYTTTATVCVCVCAYTRVCEIVKYTDGQIEIYRDKRNNRVLQKTSEERCQDRDREWVEG